MLVFYLLLFLKGSIVEARSLPPSQEIISSSSVSIQDESFEKACNLKSENDVPYLMAWQDIPQRCLGCSVPYYGPQGHGQHPEEVHLVHITNVDELVQSLSSQHKVMATVTVWLDAAICGNETVPSEAQYRPSQNDSNTMGLKENNPSILKLKTTSASHSADLFPSHEKQESLQSSSNPTIFKVARPLVLLLTSDQPVIWQIKPGDCWTRGMASRIQATVEKDSTVVSDILVEVVPKTWVKKINRKSIQRYARRTFHGIASFTQIRGANSVRIIVGPAGPSSRENTRVLSLHNRNKLNFCDFSSREESTLVSASLSVPVSAEACIFGDKTPIGLFIVEVQSLPISAFRGMVNDKSTSPVNNSENRSLVKLPTVTVHLSDNKSTFKGANFPEQALSNITVILRSQQHVQWSLHLFQHANINVVTTEGDTVECINKCANTVKLSSLPLPQLRSDLLHKVMAQYGSSVYYFSITYATGFSLTIDYPNQKTQQIGKFQKRLPSPDTHLPPWSVIQGPSYPPANLSDRKKDIQSIFESEMIIVCGKSTLEIVVSAPVLMQLGVTTLFLNDQSCQSYYNGTHFILASSFQSCGSKIHTDDRTSVISNSVHVAFMSQNDEVNTENIVRSLPNSNLAETEGIPVACGIKPTIDEDVLRSIFNSRDDVTSEEEEGVRNSSPNSGSSIYQLELYHRDPTTASSIPIKYGSLIDLNNRIYVRAWMDDAPVAQAVTESCWVSNLPYSALWLPNQKIVLLSGLCPVEKNVKLEQPPPFQAKSFLFSFQVSRDFLQLGQELYVHCQVGLCISSLKHSKGKAILCVDPQEYCLLQDPLVPRPNAVSTAHQLLSRGPLRFSSGNHSTTSRLPLETKCAIMPSFPYSATIGMDMAVAIALGSFIIGIGLTATLWLIHKKTEPIHRGCHVREHSLGSQSAVMGSSLSPHSACSSTNSQSAIAS